MIEQGLEVGVSVLWAPEMRLLRIRAGEVLQEDIAGAGRDVAALLVEFEQRMMKSIKCIAKYMQKLKKR